MRETDVNINEILRESTEMPRSYLGMNTHNNTHHFLAPIFGIRAINGFRDNYVNSYIDDGGRKNFIERPLYCLFKFTSINESNPDVRAVASHFSKYKNYIFSYFAGIENGMHLVMYVMRATDDIKEDYDKIIRGEYSKISETSKMKYLTFGFTYEKLKFINDVVNKNEAFKTKLEQFLKYSVGDGELWTKFEDEREIFRYRAAA